MGKVIIVKVGGKEYNTRMENGVQRFVPNKLIKHLYDAGVINLNQLRSDYADKKFTKREYAEFNMQIGYSVSGFAELSCFQDYKIENPIWDKKRHTK